MSQTPEELAKKIQAAREKQGLSSKDKHQKDVPDNEKSRSGAASALRASTDLVAALIVGGFLGYWIDQWLGTKPWGMIIFFFAGFGAGFLNIYRAQMGQDYKIGFKETDKDENKEEENKE